MITLLHRYLHIYHSHLVKVSRSPTQLIVFINTAESKMFTLLNSAHLVSNPGIAGKLATYLIHY